MQVNYLMWNSSAYAASFMVRNHDTLPSHLRACLLNSPTEQSLLLHFLTPAFSTYCISITQRHPSNMSTPLPKIRGRKDMESIRTGLPHTPSESDDEVRILCLCLNPYLSPEINLVRFSMSPQSFSKKSTFRPSKTLNRWSNHVYEMELSISQ